MIGNKIQDGIGVLEAAVFTINGEVTTNNNLEKYFHPKKKNKLTDNDTPKNNLFNTIDQTNIAHYITLTVIGLLSWGVLWLSWEGWRWDGPYCRMALVGAAAWAAGAALQAGSALPPQLAALAVGVAARAAGYLDMRDHVEVDAFLRKIYPVVVLGKGSLGWDVRYMRREWRRVAALGVLPWASEVAVMACCARYLFDFPWLWGVLLGAVYASLSCPVIMPSVTAHQREAERAAARAAERGAGRGAARDWVQLVSTAGGTDTALSVGVYGLVLTFIFSEHSGVYRYVKASLALVAGAGAGAAWGAAAALLPRAADEHAPALRTLFVLVGGLFFNFLTMRFGWGGTAGVAVLACNATAAHHWRARGWPLGANPAAAAYRVLWAALEPLVFAYTGTFVVLDASLAASAPAGLAALAAGAGARLAAAWLACGGFAWRERLYVCCAWLPKTIVEAVLAPLAIDMVHQRGAAQRPDDAHRAEMILRLLLQAIVVTTPLGFLLHRHLGGWLLREQARRDQSTADRDSTERKRSTISEKDEVYRCLDTV